MANAVAIKELETVMLALANEIGKYAADGERDGVYVTADEAKALDVKAVELLELLAKPYGTSTVDQLTASYQICRNLVTAGILKNA